MKVFITGAAGYIGSHLANRLSQLGHLVTAYDDLSNGHLESLKPEIRFFKGSALDESNLSIAFQSQQHDAVIHLAGKISPRDSVLQPAEYYATNVGGLLNILKVMRLAGCHKFIFASSSSVYGQQSKATLSEIDPVAPSNPYAQSKLMSEKIIQDTAEKQKINFKILRYFNVAGAADDLTNGQRNFKPLHIVHLAARNALKKINSLSVLGGHLPTPDGTCIRDFIHVEDLVDIHLNCLDDLFRTERSEILNCGSGIGTSVLNVLQTMEQIHGLKLNYEVLEAHPSDPVSLIADIGLLIRKFPKLRMNRSGILNICESALNWETALCRFNSLVQKTQIKNMKIDDKFQSI